LAKDVGVPESNIIQWDMAETAKGEFFSQRNIPRKGLLTD
jgi:ubiquitin carboxyl-terminal hydrolase 16